MWPIFHVSILSVLRQVMFYKAEVSFIIILTSSLNWRGHEQAVGALLWEKDKKLIYRLKGTIHKSHPVALCDLWIRSVEHPSEYCYENWTKIILQTYNWTALWWFGLPFTKTLCFIVQLSMISRGFRENRITRPGWLVVSVVLRTVDSAVHLHAY